MKDDIFIVIFLSLSRYIHGYYHKLGHDIFLLCLSPLITRESSIHYARHSKLLKVPNIFTK